MNGYAVNSANYEEDSGQIDLLEDVGRLCACGCGLRLPPNTHGNTLYRDECQKRIDKTRRLAHARGQEQIGYEEREEAFLKFDYSHPEVRRYLYKEAKTKVQGGANHLSMRGLFYTVREKYKISLPHNHSRFYADDFNQMDEFKDMFKQTGK